MILPKYNVQVITKQNFFSQLKLGPLLNFWVQNCYKVKHQGQVFAKAFTHLYIAKEQYSKTKPLTSYGQVIVESLF